MKRSTNKIVWIYNVYGYWYLVFGSFFLVGWLAGWFFFFLSFPCTSASFSTFFLLFLSFTMFSSYCPGNFFFSLLLFIYLFIFFGVEIKYECCYIWGNRVEERERERERVIKFIFFCKREFPSLWMRPPFTN